MLSLFLVSLCHITLILGIRIIVMLWLNLIWSLFLGWSNLIFRKLLLGSLMLKLADSCKISLFWLIKVSVELMLKLYHNCRIMGLVAIVSGIWGVNLVLLWNAVQYKLIS